jgi:hypothetical protein
VSLDTSITLAFGIISTVISLFGVLFAYLTLRAMAIEISMYSFTSTTLLYAHLPSLSFLVLKLKLIILMPDLNLRDLENIRIQRHEHTHIVTPRYPRGELEHKTNGWQD